MEFTSETLYITGRAGAGKSSLLNYFRKHTAKKVVVLAPTGLAALHVGGSTIHSLSGFPYTRWLRAILKYGHGAKGTHGSILCARWIPW